MDMEFFSLQLNREEATELHAALIQRAILEDEVRAEKGLEPVGTRPLLEKLDMLLGLSDGQAEKLGQAMENDLWEHAWYTFTDEWAWFRATQEVEQECARKKVDDASFRRRVELRYTKDFEKFVKEIEMKELRKTA